MTLNLSRAVAGVARALRGRRRATGGPRAPRRASDASDRGTPIPHDSDGEDHLERLEPWPQSGSLRDVDSALGELLGDCKDITKRHLQIAVGARGGIPAMLVYVDGLIDSARLDQNLLHPLLHMQPELAARVTSHRRADLPQFLGSCVVSIASDTGPVSWSQAIRRVLAGHVALFVEGCETVLTVQLPGSEHRGVQTPTSERVVKGPKDGFTETLRVNTALVRRRVRDVNLRVTSLRAGRRTSTDMAVVYIDGVANPRIVHSVIERIGALDIDRVTDSNNLQSYIEDNKWSPFPQVVGTERPDEAVGHLLEGRILVLVDNSSTALVLPVTIRNFLVAGEDYAQRWPIVALVRALRGGATLAGLFAPALYIALTSFHPALLPTKLLINVGVSRLNVPFPAIVEALLLALALELLTEASIRLPGVMGPTIGVVGGLIIGQAAVNSGLVSAGMVVVISTTAIGTFTVPKQELVATIRCLRYPLMLAAWAWGLFGVMMGALAIIMHICELHSFGVPYTSPLAPLYVPDLQDDLTRLPLADETERSRSAQALDTVKGSTGRG